MANCRPYDDGSFYDDGELYCDDEGLRGKSLLLYEATVHALSVRIDHAGFFLLDTVKALAQDAKYAQAGAGVFPDLASVTYLSVKIEASGAFRLDAIRPVVRVLTKQPVG